jgi:hypothetical protein
LFYQIPNANTANSPGILNYLAVWGTDGSRAVTTFYGVPAITTECGGGSDQLLVPNGPLVVFSIAAANTKKSKKHQDRGSRPSVALNVPPLVWQMHAKGFGGALAKFNGNWLLGLNKVEVAGSCEWTNRTIPASPPAPANTPAYAIKLSCESPLPKTWTLTFGNPVVATFTRPAPEFNPKTTNSLWQSFDSTGAPAVATAPNFLIVSPG